MAEKAGRQMSVAEAYRHFGENDVKGTSALYERVATAIADSPDALAVIDAAPPQKRHPTVVLAALHDQVLLGNAPKLADAYATRDVTRVGAVAVETLVALRDAVIATATARQTQTNETGRCAVLYPAIAEAARRLGANRIGLIDVGCSAGLNLNVDQCAITYTGAADVMLGDPTSVLRLDCETRGDVAVPTQAMPWVAARIGIDLNPVDVTNPDDARWLRACLWPDQPERIDRLNAAMELSAQSPPVLLAGDALDVLPDAFAMVPSDVTPIVTTTWALAYFSLEDRLRFLRRLDERAATGPLGWVSAEGVGIAPAVPTNGASRLSPHSVVGCAVFDAGHLRVDAVARCHPHGNWLEWTS